MKKSTVRVGDVVVFTSFILDNQGLYGALGLVIESNDSKCTVIFGEEKYSCFFSEIEVIDHDESLLKEPIPEFKVGDRVQYVGDWGVDTLYYLKTDGKSWKNFKGYITDIGANCYYIEWDNVKGKHLYYKDNIDFLKDLKKLSELGNLLESCTEVPHGLGKSQAVAHTVYPLDLPGGANSWLLAIDVSASVSDEDRGPGGAICRFIANHNAEFTYKVAETVTFDINIKRKYMGMPGTSTMNFKEGHDGTEIECVLGHALVQGIKNVLLFSDGYFPVPPREKFSGLNVMIVKEADGKASPLSWQHYLHEALDSGNCMGKSDIILEHAKKAGIPIVDLPLFSGTHKFKVGDKAVDDRDRPCVIERIEEVATVRRALPPGIGDTTTDHVPLSTLRPAPTKEQVFEEFVKDVEEAVIEDEDTTLLNRTYFMNMRKKYKEAQ